MSRSSVVVIGAGVVGLSSALILQQSGYAVTIVAKHFPQPTESALVSADPTLINYTSLWGGAHNRWVVPSNSQERKEHTMALATFRHMDKTYREFPEAGIRFMKGIEYMEAPSQVYRDLTKEKAEELGLVDFEFLTDKQLPDDKVKWACQYKTWCVSPMVYCAFLLRRFCLEGGRILKRDLLSIEEAFGLKEATGAVTVINCSGAGFSDPLVFPTRGQTCLVANTCTNTVTRQNADGSWSFSVPRNFGGGTVIGGTKEPHDWSTEARPETRATLLDAFTSLCPGALQTRDGTGQSAKVGDLQVLGDVVGRRPTRKGGARLETEELPKDGQSRTVVHAYGVGGRGYELSWGVAEWVLGQVQEVSGVRAKL